MSVAARDVERRFIHETSPDAIGLLAAIAQGLSLAESAHATARVLALNELGDIELPDATPGTKDDQAQIRAIGPLYLAAQLEETGLLSAVETLSGLAISGALQGDLGAAAHLIENFWQGRNDRFHEKERRALFARLFGAEHQEDAAFLPAKQGANASFENLMIDLAESLYKLDEQSLGGRYGNIHAQNRLAMAARMLAENLLHRGGGMTAFAAKEILTTIQDAVRILQQAPVQHAFGARSMWSAVRVITTRYLHLNRETSSLVARGKSGLVILSWLADSLPHLNRSPLPATPDHPVVGAAIEWLQASLSIREAMGQSGG
jgi:hypothetical protein